MYTFKTHLVQNMHAYEINSFQKKYFFFLFMMHDVHVGLVWFSGVKNDNSCYLEKLLAKSQFHFKNE